MKFAITIIIQILVICVTHPIYAQDFFQLKASYFGTHPYERVGYHVHSAGDINGDGYDDFMIGNFHTQKRGYNSGATYLILGKPNRDWQLNRSLKQADARFLGRRAYDAVGYCLGGNGDINGDGLDDMVIGAPAGDETVFENPGHIYLVFGRRAADWGEDFILSKRADASFDGENAHDIAGLSVAIIGDINQDGYDDVLCGAPYNDYGHKSAGKAYLILGKANGWRQGVNLREAAASFHGTYRNGLAGYAVDGLGDVNGDGIIDFGIGARGESAAYIFFGRKNVGWGTNCPVNRADLKLYTDEYDDWTGWRVSRAGDVNADGLSDILVSSPKANANGSNAGEVYLVFGRRGGWRGNLHRADASFIGEASDDQAGWDVQDAGDVDGDGFDDFLIGAWYNDSHGKNAGKVYLIRGKATGWHRNTRLSSIRDYFAGEHHGDYAGFSVASAGDVNRDGRNDILASATYNSEAFRWGGKILLFLSDAPSLPRLDATPEMLDFDIVKNELFLQIENRCQDILQWNTTTKFLKHHFYSFTPRRGKLMAGAVDTIRVIVNRKPFVPGIYHDTFAITTRGEIRTVGVRMHIPSFEKNNPSITRGCDRQAHLFELCQNYPNPFNPLTRIRFHLPVAAQVKLTVFNLHGQMIDMPVQKDFSAGTQQIIWPIINGSRTNLPSGIYFYHLEAISSESNPIQRWFQTKKMILAK